MFSRTVSPPRMPSSDRWLETNRHAGRMPGTGVVQDGSPSIRMRRQRQSPVSPNTAARCGPGRRLAPDQSHDLASGHGGYRADGSESPGSRQQDVTTSCRGRRGYISANSRPTMSSEPVATAWSQDTAGSRSADRRAARSRGRQAGTPRRADGSRTRCRCPGHEAREGCRPAAGRHFRGGTLSARQGRAVRRHCKSSGDSDDRPFRARELDDASPGSKVAPHRCQDLAGALAQCGHEIRPRGTAGIRRRARCFRRRCTGR